VFLPRRLRQAKMLPDPRAKIVLLRVADGLQICRKR
jgi:hypothetical protein